MKKPKIICICGSTKFKEEYLKAQFNLTMEGRIVLTVGCFMHADNVEINKQEKKMLDELHLRKIDLADEILVLNKNGYIGESTRKEIQYALYYNKPVKYLEPI